MEYGVYELVNDHIIHHLQRSQDEPPGKAERARGTAGAPARAGSGDTDPFVLKIKLAGEEFYTGSQHLPGLLAVPAFKRDFCIALPGERQLEFPIIEPQVFPLSLHKFQGVIRSQVEEHFPGHILPRCRWKSRKSFCLLCFNPSSVLLDKLPDHGYGGPPWRANEQRTVGSDNQGKCLSLTANDLIDRDCHEILYSTSAC